MARRQFCTGMAVTFVAIGVFALVYSARGLAITMFVAAGVSAVVAFLIRLWPPLR